MYDGAGKVLMQVKNGKRLASVAAQRGSCSHRGAHASAVFDGDQTGADRMRYWVALREAVL
ncbi:hypothetical protein CK489_07405 [Bradyrhizobium sp. UFLA03-84]|nr:hypothetical protein CK489_07405 [Bradyrhizobium sp. UFLA03-84]